MLACCRGVADLTGRTVGLSALRGWELASSGEVSPCSGGSGEDSPCIGTLCLGAGALVWELAPFVWGRLDCVPGELCGVVWRDWLVARCLSPAVVFGA